ncbi:MAG: SDR family NAD(P)-dependent oxidoreductase [Pseudomonadota bacterium]
MRGPLHGRRALVTGAARGIGRAIAEALAAEGAELAVADIRDCTSTASAIVDAGGRALPLACDVAREEQVEAMFRDALGHMGGLDIVVSNAGVILERPLVDTTLAEYEWVMGINLRGCFLVGREALRHMAAQKSGRLINIASDLGYGPREQFSVYSASKAGVLAFTRAWAREFGPHVLVNAVAPGPVDTDMLALDQMSPEWRAKEEQIPLGRVGKPEEIAAVAVFLAGPGASFITGQVIGPNGGSVMP